MMPDLGAYAGPVLLAYGVSLGLLVALVLWVWLAGRRTQRDLAALEARLNRRENATD